VTRTPRTPKKRARGRARVDWRPIFLDMLRQTGMVTAAAAAAGIGRRTAYDHRARDRAFAGDWDDVLAEAIEELEAEAYRRAVDGVERPVFHGGQEAGTIREYSDQLAMFLLRARKPEMYSERYQVQHAAATEKPLPTITVADPEVQAASRELLRAVGRARERHGIARDTPVRLDLSALTDDELAELHDATSEAGEIVQ
jgi:hypothetical protein